MKFGAIDIGTNSMRILIAGIENNHIIESYKDLRTTRIGENVNQTGELSIAAMQRNIDALKEFMGIVRKEGIKKIPVIATSAVRDAKNREVFIKRAKEEIDVEVEVITGEREAYLGFLGVRRGLKEDEDSILVIDIGGGSTEFILGNKSGIQHATSINVGAVRMTEKFVRTDPVSKSEIENMVKEIDQTIQDTIHDLRKFQFGRVIGIGGTATSLGAVAKKLKVYNRDEIHNYHLAHDVVKKILDQFQSKNLEERKKMPGLQPKRADVITAGTIILDRILTGLRVDEIRISEYDNLEGLIFEQMDS